MASVHDTIQNSNVTPLTYSNNREDWVQLRRDLQINLNGFAGSKQIKRARSQFLFDPSKQLEHESVYSFPVRP
jgi:hypothetical protein